MVRLESSANISQKFCDVFDGLKTAVLTLTRRTQSLDETTPYYRLSRDSDTTTFAYACLAPIVIWCSATPRRSQLDLHRQQKSRRTTLQRRQPAIYRKFTVIFQ